MRKKIILLAFLISLSSVYAYDYYCPVDYSTDEKAETLINKITGLSFTSKKIAETVIEKELKEALDSKFDADLEIFNVKRMKNGEFKSLKLKSKRIQYKSFSMSDFTADTQCDYNKIYYNKGKIAYPYDVPMKFSAKITNDDLRYALTSKKVQDSLQNNQLKANGNNVLSIRTPDITIKDSKIYYTVPLETILGPMELNFNSELSVRNNTLMLENISPNSIFNVISNKILEKINPFQYDLGSLNGKYCKIYVTKAQISDNIIKTEGVFLINKNYDGDK